ncbi:MAG: hypothetical protein ING29_13190 [Azospirillum sp.]|nr:hypothetical protein [Azospirillum sp.]
MADELTRRIEVCLKNWAEDKPHRDNGYPLYDAADQWAACVEVLQEVLETRAAPPPEPSEANTYAALLAHWKSLTPLVPDPELELVARAIYEVCLADEPCNNEEWAELRASTDPRQSGLFKHYLDMARAAIAALRAAKGGRVT